MKPEPGTLASELDALGRALVTFQRCVAVSIAGPFMVAFMGADEQALCDWATEFVEDGGE